MRLNHKYLILLLIESNQIQPLKMMNIKVVEMIEAGVKQVLIMEVQDSKDLKVKGQIIQAKNLEIHFQEIIN